MARRAMARNHVWPATGSYLDRLTLVLDDWREIGHLLVSDEAFAIQHPGRFGTIVHLLKVAGCQKARQ